MANDLPGQGPKIVRHNWGVRRLLPGPAGEVDPFELYADAPAVRVGMVASVDGSATDEDGWTDGLGGAADFRVFRVLRAHADGIMMGASTVRTGRIRAHRMRPGLRARRTAAGRPEPAPIIVVSRSLDLDWDAPPFTDAATPTIVVTCGDAKVPDRARAVVTEGDDVDLPAALAELRTRFGIHHLLCEGGPSLAGALITAGLADELCLSVAPALIGDVHRTPLVALSRRAPAELTGVATDDGVLFLRYRF